MKRFLMLTLGVVFLLACGSCDEQQFIDGSVKLPKVEKWSEERANTWYEEVGVIKGCNYLPRTAGNSTEMWQASTFTPDIIDQEFGWAETYGYNNVRVFLQYAVWKDDAEGLKQRMDQFMSIAYKHGISVMWVLFDDCAFGYPATKEPYLGPQGDPKPGEYSPYWTPSPGHGTAVDPKAQASLEAYVKDIVGTFANDQRVLVWDMYNEPGNSGAGTSTLPLVEKSFQWTRAMNPIQPVTVGAYQTELDKEIPQRFMELSDVITFHSYDNVDWAKVKIQLCEEFNRPVICTEFIIRRNNNTFFAFLPLFAEHNVGWYQWGLVAGRTQTYLHWTHKAGDPVPKTWQHDVFYTSGLPYDPTELEMVKVFEFYDDVKTILPTSEYESQDWNYIMDTPNYGWHMPGKYNLKQVYQGTTWKNGKGAFGSDVTAPSYVQTNWSSNNIWLRKTFEVKDIAVNPYLRIRHDEEFEVYINGELAAKGNGYNTFYEYIPFSRRARAALKVGENVISVHGHKPSDSRGGQYIDVGVVDIVVSENSVYYVKPEPEPTYEIETGTPWSAEKAWQWYKSIPVTKGANFLPSTAVNSVEMWQQESFDPETIDRELGYAAKAGYNSMRVFLQYAVWEDDPSGFLNRFDKYLEISAKHGITTMPIFFDDCCWSMKLEPLLGKQDDSLPGAHNTGWVPSPGYSMSLDQGQWHKLEKFVRDTVARFRTDKRILVWDTYNEPGPGFDATCTSHPLVKATFGWIRKENPTQPVTVGSFANPRSMELHQYSDVITHHDYGSAGLDKFFTEIYEKHKRPVFITECMIRGGGGDFKSILPYFSKYNAGFYNWGFAAGRSQCYYHFSMPLGTPIPEVWCCEIVWPDGKAYDPEEIRMIQQFDFEELSDEIKEMIAVE